jgi:hypothetical protein
MVVGALKPLKLLEVALKALKIPTSIVVRALKP